MPHINLLPWREEQRKQRNKDFTVACVLFAILALGAVGGVHYWFAQQIPVAPEYVDLNTDGGVSIFDFPAFANNFGVGLVFPVPASRDDAVIQLF